MDTSTKAKVRRGAGVGNQPSREAGVKQRPRKPLKLLDGWTSNQAIRQLEEGTTGHKPRRKKRFNFFFFVCCLNQCAASIQADPDIAVVRGEVQLGVGGE